MKYVDFSVQSILFVAVLVILLFNLGGSDTLLLVLSMQLVIGPWQLLSSLISVGLRAGKYKLKVIHLIISGVYLASLFLWPFGEFPKTTMKFIFMVPAWSLAVYYYILTILSTFKTSARQSSFLPHTSF